MIIFKTPLIESVLVRRWGQGGQIEHVSRVTMIHFSDKKDTKKIKTPFIRVLNLFKASEIAGSEFGSKLQSFLRSGQLVVSLFQDDLPLILELIKSNLSIYRLYSLFSIYLSYYLYIDQIWLTIIPNLSTPAFSRHNGLCLYYNIFRNMK